MSRNTKKGSASKSFLWIAVIVIVAVIAYIALTTNDEGSATPVTNMTGTVEVGQTQKVSWSPSDLVGGTVSVNLIKKVSDGPATYELVRTIASTKPNDGIATWVPSSADVGSGLSIEIGCAPGPSACTALDNFTGGLAVVDNGNFANTAAAFASIEAKGNK